MRSQDTFVFKEFFRKFVATWTKLKLNSTQYCRDFVPGFCLKNNRTKVKFKASYSEKDKNLG
jgi:hypothetical protein